MSFTNPLVEELYKSIFKEASKQGVDLAYKSCALRCLSDLVQFSSSQFKDAYFEQYWSNFVLKLFETDLEELFENEKIQREQLIDQLANRDRAYTQETGNPDASSIEEDILKKPCDENLVRESRSSERKKEKSSSNQDKDEEENAKTSALKLICLETLGKCWPSSADTQGKQYLIHTLVYR